MASFTFLNYILLIMLLKSPQFFPFCPPPRSIPHSLRQSPHHCSCPWIICIGSSATLFPVLHFTPPWLLCNYLFVFLNPLTSSPIPPRPLPSGNHQNALHIHDSISVLLCLVCGGLIDMYLLPFYCSYI